MDDETTALAGDVLASARRRGLTIATAESCTGGLIAAALTAIAGSSDVFLAGYVTYSNDAKTRMLGVDADLIASVGAVSEEVARLMAEGAMARSGASLAVSVTGVAGPGGGSPGKPVGLVHFGLAPNAAPTAHRACRYGEIGRTEVRRASVLEALKMLRDAAD